MSGEYKKLKDICIFQPPKSEARKALEPTDEVSFVPMCNLSESSKDLQLEETKKLSEVSSSYTYFADGDVLLAKITPCFENGKLGIARNLENGIGFGSSEYIVLRAKQNLVAEYLYYFLSQTKYRTLGKNFMTGAAGHRRIPKDYVMNTKLLTPPIEEQKRIVAILDEAFEQIDQAKANAEQNLKNARELFNSFLQSAFHNGLHENKTVTLTEIADVIDSLHKTPKYKENTIYPMVRVTDIRNGIIDLSKAKTVDAETFEEFSKRHKPNIGDLVLSRVGTYGVPALVTTEEPFCLGQNTAFLIPKINSHFLYYFLRSPESKKQIDSMVSGSTQPTISLKSIKSIKIPLVSAVEQKNIVSRIIKIEHQTNLLVQIYQQKIIALEELKQSLLQKAFSGELTKSADGDAA